MKALDSAIKLIGDSGVSGVSVVYREPLGGRAWSIDADDVFHAASTMKIGVMMEVFRQAQMGRLSLNDVLPVCNEFTSIADGSIFSLDSADDADPSLYEFAGREVGVRDLVRRMIVRSSNLATNLLVDRIGASSIQSFMGKLGAPDVVIPRGVADQAAFDRGLNCAVTARGLAHLLTKLVRREVVSPEASHAMLDILLAQELNEGIPAGLPPGTPIAHKTGWNSVAYHDAAVIDPHGASPKVFVVLTNGFESMEQGGAFVAALTQLVFHR